MRVHLQVAAAIAIVLAAPSLARADDDPVDAAKKKLDDVRHYLKLSCPARARAAFVEAEKACNALGEFEKEKVADDLRFLKEECATAGKDRDADRFCKQIDRMMDPLERAVEDAKSYPDDRNPQEIADALTNFREVITDDDNQKLLGNELFAKYERKLQWLADGYKKNRLSAWIKKATEWSDKIQSFIDGKDENNYTDTVEKWFKWADENLDKCGDDPRAKEVRAKVAKQRAAFDKAQEEAAMKEVVEPAAEYWAHVNEEYGAEAKGWEAEKTVNSLKNWLHNAPPVLGCPKTEQLLREVVARWFEDERVKQCAEKYPNAAAFKKVYDEATRIREEAGNKVCAFINKLLDEEEKLPAGEDREDAQRLLDEMARLVTQDTKGSTACEKTLTRIQALDKRWKDAKEKGEADRAALEKKLTEATNAAWPDLIAALKGKVKKLDAPAALGDIKAWKGTVVHFTGGAKGVNLNRSGWNYSDQYDFIVEKDGIPVCGNYDEGLGEALKAFTGATGVEPDTCEEAIGIVDGTCKVWERIKHPLDPDRYVRGRQLDAVRIRIVAWKACTVAAVAGKGTSLPKAGLPDVACPEKGSTR